MPIEYMKLVRDRIPEIIRSEGRDCRIEVMSDEEFRQALLVKLAEESSEVASASLAKLPTELADLLEVVDAILTTFDIEMSDVRTIQEERRLARGGFEKRIRLISTD